jgi:hypothetical protein
MHEFEDDLGKALERQADRLLGPEFSIWRGAKIEDTGPEDGEPDDGRRHRPIPVLISDDEVKEGEPAKAHQARDGNSQLEILDFVDSAFKLDDVDMWLWAVMTMPDDPDDDDNDETTKFYIERDPLMTEPVRHGHDAQAQIRARNSLIMSHIASGVPAVGIDDGFVAPPDHDPDPVCSTGFFVVTLKQRTLEYAREQGGKLKLFRPRRRFTHTKPKLAQPHRVKAALMKLRA